MRIHSLHHAPFEGLGCIKNWADSKEYTATSAFLYESINFPQMQDFDMLIIMGGPMGVYEEEKYSWLRKEKLFIKKALEEGKIILGICLGSQLLAEVLGAKVYKNKFTEIGWFPVNFTKEAAGNPLFNFLPKELIVFHWHGDTFDLPSGAVHLAQSAACKNQAFIFGEKVIGLQFHFEVTRKSIDEMLKGSENELIKETYVQTPEEVMNMADYGIINNNYMFKILDRMEEAYNRENSKQIKAF